MHRSMANILPRARKTVVTLSLAGTLAGSFASCSSEPSGEKAVRARSTDSVTSSSTPSATGAPPETPGTPSSSVTSKPAPSPSRKRTVVPPKTVTATVTVTTPAPPATTPRPPPAVTSTSNAPGPHLVSARVNKKATDFCYFAGSDSYWVEYEVTLDVYGPTAKHRWAVMYYDFNGSRRYSNPIAQKSVAGGMRYTLTSGVQIHGPQYDPVHVDGDYVSDADTNASGQRPFDLQYENGGLTVTLDGCPKF